MGRPRVARVTITCANCGNQAEKYYSNIKNNKTGRFFCSEACRRELGSKPQTLPRKTCELCGKEFVSYSVGRFCSKEHYDEWQRRRRVPRVCEWCGKEFDRPPAYETRQAARWCSRACASEARIKRPTGREHNGRPAVLDHHGYVRVYEPSHPGATRAGWMHEHRVVAEQAIGRALLSDEHVHHINGVKSDNRPENLVVLGHGEHSTLTGAENGRRIREWEEYRKRYGPLDGS